MNSLSWVAFHFCAFFLFCSAQCNKRLSIYSNALLHYLANVTKKCAGGARSARLMKLMKWPARWIQRRYQNFNSLPFQQMTQPKPNVVVKSPIFLWLSHSKRSKCHNVVGFLIITSSPIADSLLGCWVCQWKDRPKSVDIWRSWQKSGT